LRPRPAHPAAAVYLQRALIRISRQSIPGYPGPASDPRSIGLKPSGNCLPVHQGLTGITLPIDQGSVLAVRVFGSLSIYFTPQPEVVPGVVIIKGHTPGPFIIYNT